MSQLEDVTFLVEKKKECEDSCFYDISIRLPMSLGWIEGVKFIVETSSEREAFQLNHVENVGNFALFSTSIELPVKALYHFYFSFSANGKFYYYKKENQENYSSVSKDDMWKMSVGFDVPDWAKGKIMYHIFVDRFYKGREEDLPFMERRTIHKDFSEDMVIGPDSNGIWNADFYGGDLEGIIQKLDYIKSLGVSILYLSPIVWSQSNHRYDTSDYEQVDPYVGVNEDLERLCFQAHKMGMRVILDAVFNHTGNDSKYFNEYGTFPEVGAYQSKDSIYFPMYRKYYQHDQVFFDYWWGMKNLPVCDGNSSAWQEYIYGVGGIIDQWFQLGIDGLRLDVADELSDSFISGIRKAVKRNKSDGFLLGEVWKNPMRMSRGYIESGRGMDSVMNYPLMDALIRYFKYADVYKLREIVRQLKTEYPSETLQSLMNFTSTHDITRAINIFGTKEFQYSGEWAWNLNNGDLEWQKNYVLSPEDYQKGKEIYKSYIYALLFLPGNLSIFYGDEVGVQGMGNLCNRKPFPWNSIDYDLLNFFKEVGNVRKKETFLEKADFYLTDINDSYFSFERVSEKERALVYINRSSEMIPLSLPYSYQNFDAMYSLGNSNEDEISSHGALVLKKVL